MKLAYLVWHQPRPEILASDYEGSIVEFHRRLMDAKPLGLRSARAFGISAIPWLPTPGPSYEDWYELDSFAALDVLTPIAVSPTLAQFHSAVAAASGAAAAGLYRERSSSLERRPPVIALWLNKPRGVSDPDFVAVLRSAVEPCDVWQRQLILGAAPEFLVLSEGSRAALPNAVTVDLRAIAGPAGAPRSEHR